MSWISVLCETYEHLSELEEDIGLLPIAHTTQKAQIEVTIDCDGDFVTASVVNKEDAETVVPCTDTSAGRSGSHPVNHPLMDKLQYLAGDYTACGGTKGESFHEEYMLALNAWCSSPYKNEKVDILHRYLEKGTLIRDLIKQGILYCDSEGKLIEKWNEKENVPEIFKVIQGSQSDAFVRFRVSGVDNKTALWQDRKVQQDYIAYYKSIRTDKKCCYVTGEEVSCTVNHPNKIRNTGDKAKLISANDQSGFTYRGRFLNGEDAVCVSYDVSQKAHNALKFLIGRNGRRYGTKVFISWNPKGYAVPTLEEDSLDFTGEEDEKQLAVGTEFASRFQRALGSIGELDLESHESVVIMGIDAATTGRMAITFYRELLYNELMKRVIKWHTGCAWKHRYRFNKEKKRITFYGAPAAREIARAAFGTEHGIDDKLSAATVERIWHCITDGAAIPYDIVNAAYRNACHPQNYENKGNWETVLSICCSLVKKYLEEKNKEEWTVELQTEKKDLEYQCGRLLAVADVLEWSALSESTPKDAQGKKNIRTTNAMRYFTKFREHPNQTWKIISEALVPYIIKLGETSKRYQKMLGEISDKIDPDEFAEAKNLDGRMALGFYAQKNYMFTKQEQADKGGTDDDTITK